ncbi:MAG: hypothetical protein ACRD1H_07685 [Vicinamibacterales bacterium]
MATTLWPILDIPHAPSKASIERHIAQARDQLGEDAWQAAWATGETLAPDTLIAGALAESRGIAAT